MLFRIGIALIAVGLIGGIAAAIFWDGPDWDRDETVEYRVVNEDGSPAEGGTVTLVREDDRDGPGPFFPFVPLVIVGGVLTTVALVNRRGGGPGRWGDPRARFDEWHRDAHRENGPPSSPSTPAAS